MIPAARTLAEWAGGLRAEDVPPAVRDNAALRVLDTIGCALAGAREEHVPAVLGVATRWGGGGARTILGSAARRPPPGPRRSPPRLLRPRSPMAPSPTASTSTTLTRTRSATPRQCS